jgi:hypothetical protein
LGLLAPEGADFPAIVQGLLIDLILEYIKGCLSVSASGASLGASLWDCPLSSLLFLGCNLVKRLLCSPFFLFGVGAQVACPARLLCIVGIQVTCQAGFLFCSWYTCHLLRRGSEVPFSPYILKEPWIVSLKFGVVLDLKQNEIPYHF